jgi:hypothetical protein
MRRFEKVLYPSLTRHLKGSGIVKDFIIVCREVDRRKIPNIWEPLLRVITDEQVLGEHNWLYRNPWLKQQALKLCIHSQVETDTYLVLDADCFAVKDLRDRDLFPEGKARLGVEDREVSQFEWWAQSSELLEREDTSRPEWPHIGVTPQILYTRIVTGLLNELENIHQMDPREILGKNKFTEFTLYWLYLLRVSKPEDLYYMDNSRLALSKGVWSASQRPISELKELLREGRTCFGLVQSLLGIDPGWIAEIIEGKRHGEKEKA